MHRFTISTCYSKSDDKEDEYVKLYDENTRYRYNEVVQEIGFGYYQYKIILNIAFMNISIGVFIALISFLIPIYKKAVDIGQFEVGLLVSSQGLGSLLGGIAFGNVSDSYGRRIALITALVISIIASVISSTFSTFWPFLIFRFLAAFGQGGLAPVGITYLSEYLPDDSRGFYLICMDLFRNLGGVLTIIFASYTEDNWRLYVLAPVPMFMITALSMKLLLPESNRYLMYIGDIDEVVENFNKMSEDNGKSLQVKYCENDDDSSQRNIHVKEVSIWKDLIIKKASTTIPLSFVWFFPAFGTGVFVFLPEIMILEGFRMKEIYYVSGYLLFLPMFGIIISSFFIDNFGRKQLISI